MKKMLMMCLVLLLGVGTCMAAKPAAQKKTVTTVFKTDVDCEHCVTRIMNNVPVLGKGIKDVQVAGVPSKKYGEAVGAFIILHEGYTMNEFDVREFCQGKIARYKIPKYIFFVKEFPMTGSGKIQKFKLKDLSLKLCAEQGIEII